MPSSSLSPFINQEYSSVYAYAGVEAIKSRLAEQGAIVVLNEDDTYLGVITPTDVLLQPHRLVIDCLRSKPVIHPDHSVIEALNTMLEHQEVVLPVVYHRGELAGLLHQRTLVQHLMKENSRLSKDQSIPPLRR